MGIIKNHILIACQFGDIFMKAGLLESEADERKKIFNEKSNEGLSLSDVLGFNISKQESASINKFEPYFHKIATKLINFQEYERKRLSGELHDGVGQMLSVLKYQVELMLYEPEGVSRKRKCDKDLHNVLDNITLALNELRGLSLSMQSSITDDIGLAAAIRRFINEYSSIYTGQHVNLKIEATDKDIPENIRLVIYRIIQEAMNNIARHSAAKNVLVKLRVSGGGIYLRIKDDGCGFDLLKINQLNKTSVGLCSMKDRAVNSGAAYSINSSVLSGTIIQVFWKTD